MFKLNKNFSKIYRYYCRELSKLWLTFLLMLIYVGLFMMMLVWGKNNLATFFKDKGFGWKEYLGIFWVISLAQAFILYILAGQGVKQLSGFPIKLQVSFKLPKQDIADDIKNLIFTPGITRETIILAKFAAIFTYFFAINLLLLTLPLFFHFFTYLPLLAALSFLLLNGLVFSLVNFLLIVPYLFYLYDNYSMSSVVIMVVLIAFFALSFSYFQESIIKYSFILPLVFIPLFSLSGYIFFTLYKKKFLKKDLS